MSFSKKRLNSLITQHLSYYESDEKGDFDRARSYYRGDFWENAQRGAKAGDARLNSAFAQKNLIFAITETAISSLLGPNPQVGAMPQTPESQEMAGGVNGLMSWAFRQTNMRRRSALGLMDAVLCKRGIFKTSWDAKADAPVVSNPNTSSVFFDLSVRDNDDIRYWIQACPLTPAAYRKKIKEGRYKHHADITAEAFPTWLRDDVQRTAMNKFTGVDKRILIYEYYDRETGDVVHYHKDTNHVLFRGSLDYIPYSMFSLNHSGVDCTGISEVQLVLDQQTNINQLLTLWKRVVYLNVPKILYDAGQINSADLDKAMAADMGSFIPVDAEGTEGLRNFGALFYAMPMPGVPDAVIQFISRLESDAAFQSALAEAARGQVSGAKTATEMTIIDAQLRTRLATREGNLHTAVEDVGAKMFYLMQRYMQKPKLVRLAGSELFSHIGIQQLKQLRMDFEMVAYNPLRKNPAVLLETLQALTPLLLSAPNIDKFKLFEELIKGIGLPNRIVIPEAQARKAQVDAQAAAQAAALEASKGGAAVKEKPSDAQATANGAPPDVPPEMLNQVRSMAAKQGRPAPM